MIRFCGFFVFIFFLSTGLASYNKSVKQDIKPDFVFIDDIGWKDVGFMGAEYYETPNIGKLAKMVLFLTGRLQMQPIAHQPVPVCPAGSTQRDMAFLPLANQTAEIRKTGVLISPKNILNVLPETNPEFKQPQKFYLIIIS